MQYFVLCEGFCVALTFCLMLLLGGGGEGGGGVLLLLFFLCFLFLLNFFFMPCGVFVMAVLNVVFVYAMKKHSNIYVHLFYHVYNYYLLLLVCLHNLDIRSEYPVFRF